MKSKPQLAILGRHFRFSGSSEWIPYSLKGSIKNNYHKVLSSKMLSKGKENTKSLNKFSCSERI